MSNVAHAAYVMFGHSGLFGDYADTIHALGGRLLKVVTNVPDVPRPGDGRTFGQDREAMNRSLAERGTGWQIDHQDIAEFRPAAGETYVVGFRGEQVAGLRDRLKQQFALAFAPLIHPAAIVSPTVESGEGIIVAAGSVVGAFSRLGAFCLVNRGATIGHHASIGEFASIGPGANLASGAMICRAASVGIGATILNHVTVGARAFVTAGAVVTRDVEPATLVAGTPARRVKLRPQESGA
jgi:sugar O-acyltransferase (sialic acid O-acetyltransferase NeuD family)